MKTVPFWKVKTHQEFYRLGVRCIKLQGRRAMASTGITFKIRDAEIVKVEK